MFKTLLVPTDFSDAAEHAFAHALHLARQCSGTVHLLHVIEPFETGPLSPLRYTPKMTALKEMPEETIDDLLAETILRLHPGDVQVESVVLQRGPVAQSILKYADAEGAGLTVVGRNRHRGVLRRRRIGLSDRGLRQDPGPYQMPAPAKLLTRSSLPDEL